MVLRCGPWYNAITTLSLSLSQRECSLTVLRILENFSSPAIYPPSCVASRRRGKPETEVREIQKCDEGHPYLERHYCEYTGLYHTADGGGRPGIYGTGNLEELEIWP